MGSLLTVHFASGLLSCRFGKKHEAGCSKIISRFLKISIYSVSFDALAGSKEGSFVRSQEPPGELKGKMF